jgi:integrase
MLYKRGKIWWFKFRFAGRVIREPAKIGSKTLAADGERQRRRQLERNWNRVTKRTLPPLFDRAARAWLDGERPHLAERTQDIYRVALECQLVPAFGSFLLCDLDTEAVKAYQAKRKTEGASARTLNKELQVLRQVLKRHKLLADLQGEVKFEWETESPGKALTQEEESSLLEACKSNPLLHTVVTLALNTALRKNEIRLLPWSQIDLSKRILTVVRSKTEGGTGREIPLNPPAYAALIKWAGRVPESKPEHYIFPACEAAGIEREHPDKERIDPSRPIKAWRTAWRAALERAGLRIRFHDLRHTCITKLAEGQASEQTIMAIAGHLSRRMLEHIRMAAKRAALDAIAQPSPALPGINFGVGGAQNWAQIEPDEIGETAKLLN